MFRPPYWSHDSIKIPDSIINKLKSRLSDIELIDNHKSSYWMNQEYADHRPDQFLNERYDIIVEDIVKNVGVFNESTYTYTYWSQLYDQGNNIGPHNHVDKECPSDISWVHFIDVPDQKCFRFTDTQGNTLVPDDQNIGDIICFPSWVLHETIPTNEQRLIVSGNITLKFKSVDMSKYKSIPTY